jgi:hypothetical protein
MVILGVGRTYGIHIRRLSVLVTVAHDVALPSRKARIVYASRIDCDGGAK